MSGSLGVTVILYALGVALWCVYSAVRGRSRGPDVTVALIVLEAGALGQALFDLAHLLRGQHGPEVATNIGYLVASLAVLPIAAAAVRLDPGPWGSAALAVGCVLLAVLSLRLHQTLGHG